MTSYRPISYVLAALAAIIILFTWLPRYGPEYAALQDACGQAPAVYQATQSPIRFEYPGCWSVREDPGWVWVYYTPHDAPLIAIETDTSGTTTTPPSTPPILDSTTTAASSTVILLNRRAKVTATRAITNYPPTDNASESVVQSISLTL